MKCAIIHIGSLEIAKMTLLLEQLLRGRLLQMGHSGLKFNCIILHRSFRHSKNDAFGRIILIRAPVTDGALCSTIDSTTQF